MKTLALYLTFLATLFTLLVYYKLPIVCYGCDERTAFNKLFFKCITDSGEGTSFCEFENLLNGNIDKLGNFIGDTSTEALNLIRDISNTLGKIPKELKTSLKNIFYRISVFSKQFTERIQNLSKVLQTVIYDALKTVKNVAVQTYEEMNKHVVGPIIASITNYIIEPVTKIVSELIEFKTIAVEKLSNVYDKTTGIIMQVPSNIFKVLDAIIHSIPIGIEESLSAIINVINSMIKSMLSTVNTVIPQINVATKTAAKIVEEPVNAFLKAQDISIGPYSVHINLPDPGSLAKKGVKAAKEGLKSAGKAFKKF